MAAQSSPLKRKTPLKRSGFKRKRGSRGDTTARDRVAERVWCELCGHRKGSEAHHRRMRSQAGGNTQVNLVWLDAHCHKDVIHANPDWAYRHGWLVPSWREPADVRPVVGCDLHCTYDHVGCV